MLTIAQIVDFVIASLFSRNGFSSQRPQHLLAHSYQRAGASERMTDNHAAPTSTIPGLVVRYPNRNVETLKHAPWTNVLALLGGNGEEIMLRLLLDCGIFTAIDHRKGIYYQISGESCQPPVPLGEALRDDVTNRSSTVEPGTSQKRAASKRCRSQRSFHSYSEQHWRILFWPQEKEECTPRGCTPAQQYCLLSTAHALCKTGA